MQQNGRLACIDFNLHMMMMPTLLCDIINVYDFTSTCINPIAMSQKRKQSNLAGWMTSMHWSYLAGDEDVITIRSHDKHWWLYLHFNNTCSNHAWQNDRLACTGRTLQVKIMSPQLGHVTNIYDFIPFTMCPITTKFGKMLD